MAKREIWFLPCLVLNVLRERCVGVWGRKASETIIKLVKVDSLLCIWHVVPIKDGSPCSCQLQWMKLVFSWTDNRESVFPVRDELIFCIKFKLNFMFWITFVIERFFLFVYIHARLPSLTDNLVTKDFQMR